MATNFPTSLDTLANPSGSDLLDNANPALVHSAQHGDANDAIEALEAKVGANGSNVQTSHDYKLSAVTGAEKAITSGVTTQTVSGLTLVSPKINMTSDATGDMYYRNSGGVLTRLPTGTSGQILQTSASGIPEWIANPAATDANESMKGVVEEATQTEVNNGTQTGSTGASLFVNPAKLPGFIQAYFANKPDVGEVTLQAGASITAKQTVYITNSYQANPVTIIGQANSGTSQSYTITIGSGNDRALFVSVMVVGNTGSVDVTNVTASGTNMTKIGESFVANNGYGHSGKLAIYKLLNPPTGSVGITATITGSWGGSTAYAFSNVDQTTGTAGETFMSSNLVTDFTHSNTTAFSAIIGFYGCDTGISGLSDVTWSSSPSLTWGDKQQVLAAGINGKSSTSVSNSAATVASHTLTPTISKSGGSSDRVEICAAISVKPSGGTSAAVQLTDADSAGSTTPYIGFAMETKSANEQIKIQTRGVVTGLSGLVAGTTYYLSGTPGGIATSAGSNTMRVGIALSTTELLMKDMF